jgi:serine-type D-Ala-D-Ala carboxypeptidase/endopeptidase (penicillin-binding protein 4)
MRRWLLPAALLVVAVAFGSLAIAGASESTGSAALSGPAPVTPVLSPRRLPELLATVQGDLKLRAGLDSALSDPALGLARDRSCLVVRRGATSLFDRRSTTSLTPASNLKLLLAETLLNKLGAASTFSTTIKADKLPAGGVVDGPLYFVGGGDPLLQTSDYAASFKNQPQVYTPVETLAQKVVAAGIHEVKGPVLGDESRYDTQRYVPSWKPSYIADGEIGPMSALDVNDGFVAWKPQAVAAPEPAVLGAQVLNGLLHAMGVNVDTDPGAGTAPKTAVTLAEVPSLPLVDIVGEMLRESDNNTAELLTKELGLRFGGAPTTAAGLGVIRSTLQAEGIPVDQFSSADASGLDRADKATCNLFATLLEKAGPKSNLAAGLPVAAQTGTLTRRLHGTAAAGRLRAKTGSLDHIVALSGFVDAAAPVAGTTASGPSTPPLVFSLLANDLPRDSVGVTLENRVAEVLAAYPDVPSAESLAPVPVRK